MVNNIKSEGPKINCKVPGLNQNNVDFYRAFTVRGITYYASDFVVIRDKLNRLRVAQLLNIYYSRESQYKWSPYRGYVRWYIFSKDLCDIVEAVSYKLDKANEIVEHQAELNISLEDVITKCCLMVGTVNDTSACIDKTELNSHLTYFCRFKLENDHLVPLLGSNTDTNSLLYSLNDHEKFEINFMDEESPRSNRNKTKYRQWDTNNLSCDETESETENMDNEKVKSPLSPSKLMKINNISNRKNRKNMESLGTSPPPYSIIKPIDVKGDDLKMKLRVANYEHPIKVYPTKLDKNIVSSNNPINLHHTVEKDNCILLTPKCKTRQATPIPKSSSEENIRVSLRTNFTPNTTPQRRSRRINSQSKCSYEENVSLILEDIEEEVLVRSVNDISIHETPKAQIKRSSRIASRNNKKLVETTPTVTAKLKSSSKNGYGSENTRTARSITRVSSSNICTSTRKSSLKRNTSAIIASENIASVKKKLIYDSNSDSEPSTPRRKLGKSIFKSCGKDTPSARAKMVREGAITPSVPARNRAILKENTPLSKARTQLHVSSVPQALPCREVEFDNITNFLTGKLFDGSGGCMYISGVPGTGKTATVTEVIKSLKGLSKNGDVPNFTYVNVNCMRLSEPRQAYVEIAKQLTGKSVGWEQAQALLEEKFVAKTKGNSLPIVLVVDELDILCTRKQDVVYNLLDWPTKANVQLIVVAIANTMDLPERLLVGRVTSRLGLTRLTFQAYTYKQLQEIVTKRLTGTNTFNPDAIQLVARKVASVSGDARRALDICRRAVEIAEKEEKCTLVSLTHVNQALTAMITQPKVQAIKHCCKLEKLILQAVVAEMDRTGIEETNFQNVYTTFLTVATLDDFPKVSITVVKSAIARLGASRLLLVDQKSSNIYQKIILNVSCDDIHYALAKRQVV